MEPPESPPPEPEPPPESPPEPEPLPDPLPLEPDPPVASEPVWPLEPLPLESLTPEPLVPSEEVDELASLFTLEEVSAPGSDCVPVVVPCESDSPAEVAPPSLDPSFTVPVSESVPDWEPAPEPEEPESEAPSLPPSVPVSSPDPVFPETAREIWDVPGEMSAPVTDSAMTTAPSPIPKAATPIVTG